MSAEKVLEHLRLSVITPAFMEFGRRHAYLERVDVVALALARLDAGVAQSPAEEAIALLLKDDVERCDDLLSIAIAKTAPGDPARVWAYLWARDIRNSWHVREESIYDLADVIEELGVPETYRHLRYYDPAPGGRGSRGRRSLLADLDDVLSRDGALYGRVDD